MSAALVGALMAQAGVLSQGLMRNPLASPTTLGVTSGASVTVTLAVYLGLTSSVALPLSAVFGAMVSLAVMLLCARRGLGLPQTLLLGVALSAVFTAVSGLLAKEMLHDVVRTSRLFYWGMGDLASVATTGCLFLFAVFLLHSFVSASLFQRLNLLGVGEKYAISQGVSLVSLQTCVFVLVGCSVGSVVATAGSVSFIGLMVPHVSRAFFGNLAKHVFWGSTLIGACLLVIIDLVCRVALPGEELPLGVVTALLGGSFFFLILLKGRVSAGVYG